MAPRSHQSHQAVVCVVFHEITIGSAVGRREAPSVHTVVLKHMGSLLFLYQAWYSRYVRIKCLYVPFPCCLDSRERTSKLRSNTSNVMKCKWFKMFLLYQEEAFREQPIPTYTMSRLILAHQRQRDKAHIFLSPWW